MLWGGPAPVQRLEAVLLYRPGGRTQPEAIRAIVLRREPHRSTIRGDQGHRVEV